MIEEAIILAGGLGTRLKSVVEDKPKALAVVNGRPFVEYILDDLLDHGIQKLIFSVGFKAEMIQAHFGTSYRNVPIEYAVENEPLGTGGAVMFALQKCNTRHVLVCNGDSIIKADIGAMSNVHLDKNAAVTFVLKHMTNFDRYGTVRLNEDRIVDFVEKQPQVEGFINTGVYIIDKHVLQSNKFPHEIFARKGIF